MSGSDLTKPAHKYAVLEKPVFSSAIPAHLTANLSDKERYLVETLSRMEQQNAWLIERALDVNKAVVDIDYTQQEFEEWRRLFRSRYAVVLWVVTIATPVLIKYALDLMLHPSAKAVVGAAGKAAGGP